MLNFQMRTTQNRLVDTVYTNWAIVEIVGEKVFIYEEI